MKNFRTKTNTSPKRPCGFLGLPGELRNQVYGFYFAEGFRAEIAADHSKLREAPMNHGPFTLRMSRSLGHYKRIDGIRTKWKCSLTALILVCKQLYLEAIIILYHHTTFIFEAPRRIQNFLGVVSKTNLAYVTRLQLHYVSYGDPRRQALVQFQDKHVASWAKACKDASEMLVNLQELEIFIHHTGDHYFSLRHRYLQPLFQFRRLTCAHKPEPKAIESLKSKNEANSGKYLKFVKVHFHTAWIRNFTERDLTNASMELHDLFGEAISLAIQGRSEDDAMAGLKAGWKRHERWHHYLNFLTTSW